MHKYGTHLVFIFVFLIALKFFAASAMPGPYIWSDEYSYAKIAQSIYDRQEIAIHGAPINTYAPLYPLALAATYVFGSVESAYVAMKFINSFLSSLIIFPVFFLARELLSRKRAFLCAVLVSVLPANFSFTPYLMSENLFFTLFASAIYFMYKAYADGRARFFTLAGLFAGLSILTKIQGAAILLLPLVLGAIQAFKERNFAIVKRVALFYLIAFLTVAPWVLEKGRHFGYTMAGQLGSYSLAVTAAMRHEYFMVPFIVWVILYAGFIVLASGIIFPIYAASTAGSNNKDTKLLFSISALAALVLIVAAANGSAGGPIFYPSPFGWLTERAVGRYVDAILPFIFILGFKGFEQLERSTPAAKTLEAEQLSEVRSWKPGVEPQTSNSTALSPEYQTHSSRFKWLCILFSAFMAFSAQLTVSPLFPLNNLSLTYLGTAKYFLELILLKKTSFDIVFNWASFAIIAAALSAVPLLYLAITKVKRVKFSTLFLLFIVFFAGTNGLNYAIMHRSSEKFYNSEQMQLGLWLARNGDESLPVLFNSRDAGMLIGTNATHQFGRDGHFVTIAGFWLKNEIRAGNVDGTESDMYVVSRQALPKKIPIKKFGELYLYRT